MDFNFSYSNALFFIMYRSFVKMNLPAVFLGLIAMLVVTAISCGMKNLCKRREEEAEGETDYMGNGAGVQNGLAREER